LLFKNKILKNIYSTAYRCLFMLALARFLSPNSFIT